MVPEALQALDDPLHGHGVLYPLVPHNKALKSTRVAILDDKDGARRLFALTPDKPIIHMYFKYLWFVICTCC